MYNLSFSRLLAITIALALFLAGNPAYTQQSRPPRIPAYVYGTWTIYRFQEVLGHARLTKERADTQIGKTLKIGLQSFDHDKNILWLEDVPCKAVTYKLESPADSNQGLLSFHGIRTANLDIDQLIYVSCNRQVVFVFELAENQELAAYYDGWFFFFHKAKPVSKE
jgi:hypothetical protein